jgi:hypothetical protein
MRINKKLQIREIHFAQQRLEVLAGAQGVE